MFSELTPLLHDGKKLTRHLSCLFIFALVLGLISYFFLDQDLAVFFRKEENMSLWILAREVTNIGLGQHYFIFIFLFLGFLYYRGQRTWLKAWAWNSLAALSLAGLFLLLMKYLFGRQRPHISLDSSHGTFEFFNHHWDYQSFPSGHAQVLFTVATLVAVLDPKRKYLWYLLALLFSFTRVITYSHFTSDVIAGAFIGVAGSLFALYLMNRYSRFPLFKK
ncbi:MAG: phosphatase PAP2 family protein [Bdellovibrionota bacterium]